MRKLNVLSRPQIFHKYNLVFNKTMFIRSTDKPNSESVTRPNQTQPYSKFFVLDFEATCDNGAHLLKPQVKFYFKLKCNNCIRHNSYFAKRKNGYNHF